MHILDPTVTTIVRKIKVKLLAKKYKISTAESCTGGLLSAYLTSISGASLYFNHGIISYSDESKIELLKVPNEVISYYGAVSEETAKYMVIGMDNVSSSNLSIAITGIAGPNGGSIAKPVGIVCFGFSTKKILQTFTQFFKGNRDEIRHQACMWALNKIDALLK